MNSLLKIFACLSVVALLCLQASAESTEKPSPSSADVKCAVCHSLVTEIIDSIHQVDKDQTLDLGFNIFVNGEKKENVIKYRGSETQLFELQDSICEKFKDYAQARHKKTETLEVIKLVVDGKMNPHLEEYELIHDPDMNKSLVTHCHSILSDHEDEYLTYFAKPEHDDVDTAIIEFCSYQTNVCPHERDEL